MGGRFLLNNDDVPPFALVSLVSLTDGRKVLMIENMNDAIHCSGRGQRGRDSFSGATTSPSYKVENYQSSPAASWIEWYDQGTKR
jgi:hypothetical protein